MKKELSQPEVKVAIQLLNNFNVSQISVDKLSKIISFNRKLKEFDENQVEIYNKLFKSYGVEVDNAQGSYNWKTHERESEITAKVNEIQNNKLKIDKKTPGLTDDEIISGCNQGGLTNINKIEFLLDILK